MSHHQEVIVPPSKGPMRWVEMVIFNIRWLLIPFYLGLAFVLLFYLWAYFKEVIDFIKVGGWNATIEDVKVFALDTVDIVMIANLIKMICTGSYNSFVNKNHGYTNENITSGELKIKIATSIVVLAMVHLLGKAFMTTELSLVMIEKQLLIFGMFLIAALSLAYIEHLHHKE